MGEASSHDRRDPAAPMAESPPAAPGAPPSSVTSSSTPVRTDQPTVISSRPPGSAPSFHPAELDQTLLGERLDHFELLEYVGGGGMGTVFRALDTRLNRIVALKVLARDQADEEEKVRRFQNEAQSAARLDHDHIARVYFVGQDRGLHYIVFEYIDGINLRDLVERRGPLPLEEALSYTLQIAEALGHASSRDVVHRDIKPSNVLVTPQGRAKLVDMGLARLHQVDHSDDLTSSGVTLGTFDYISPEQARDPRIADVRSDIYSLGCTLFFMLTGRPPFPDGNVLQKLLQHNNDPPPDPADFNPEFPELVSRIVRKMLAKDPRRRYQSPDDLVDDLLKVIDQLGLPPESLQGLGWAASRPPRVSFLERHLPWMAPFAALVAIVLVMDRFWPASQEADPPRAHPEALQPVEASLIDTNPRPAAPGVADSSTRQFEPESGRSATESHLAPIKPPGSQPAAGSPPPPAESPGPAAVPPAASQPGSAATDERGPANTLATDGNRPSTPASPSPRTAVEPSQGGSPAAEPSSPARAAGPSSPPAGPPVEVPTPGLLVVNPSGTQPHEYASLKAAAAAAKDNDVIELRYSGRIDEKPIKLNNVKLTIRAAENHAPVVRFRPLDRLDPASDGQAMISVTGGDLAIRNVAFELEIPPGDFRESNWSLFRAQQARSLRLSGCSLTIRNDYAERSVYPRAVAFFDVKAPPGGRMMAMETMPSEPAVAIYLQNSVARGDAVFLRVAELQPVNLTWDNGLLATSQRLLHASGGELAPSDARITLDLRHLTAAVGSGLCLFINDREAPHLLPTSIQCSDSVLLTSADAPLVEHTGVSSVQDFMDRFTWSGRRYFFSGINTFWKISSLPAAEDPTELSFDAWQNRWGEDVETAHIWSQVYWKQLPDPAVPPHAHRVADYLLDDQEPENRALAAASDGADAGFIPGNLPEFPLPDEPLPDPGSDPAPAEPAAAP